MIGTKQIRTPIVILAVIALACGADLEQDRQSKVDFWASG
jgi:hypothetical protein